ncbi:MAG TPA: hypothetical protein PLA50_16485, partial [Bacteroidia bacterium]|nr:hypothetical protein [Bacteroidia bacterium]
MSSKTIDNETFASLAQEHLRSTGHYGGEIDAWAGPKTQSAYRDFAGIKDVPAPAPTPPASAPVSPGLPDAAFVYRLPSETPAALNAF